MTVSNVCSLYLERKGRATADTAPGYGQAKEELDVVKRNPNSACLICGAEFYCPPSRKAIGYGQFCSKACMGTAKRGKRDPNLTYQLPKGNVPWNKGKGRRDTTCGQCGKSISVLDSQSKSGNRFCSQSCAYAASRLPDDQLSYSVLHMRIRERYGTPSECENCGTTESKKFEWANLSGEYRIDRDDWARLCCQCHRRYDFGVKNRIELSL